MTSDIQTSIDISTELGNLEKAFDQVMLCRLALERKLIEKRAEKGISRTVGHAIFGKLSSCGQHVTEAASDVAEAHRLLQRVATTFGYPVVSEGDKGDPPTHAANVVVPIAA